LDTAEICPGRGVLLALGTCSGEREMAEFLTHMPANTVIFITMAVLGLAATLIALRS
jgi:hypothetical protein